MQAGRFTAWWAIFWGLYLLCVGELEIQEVAVGFVAALAAAIAITAVRRHGRLHFRMRRKWLLPLARVLPKTVTDCGLVLGVVCLRRIRGRSSGRFRAVPFNAGGNHADSAARRALVIAAGSFAPNSFVINVDTDALLVHQLKPALELPRDRDWPL